MSLTDIDISLFVGYVVLLIAIATWVSREKSGHKKDANDYFLAGQSLPWWAIGASLIAANISAEQIIGMTGSGYKIGLAIASYEWIAALTLLIVAKYFLPIFLAKKIYTMPQFLAHRFDERVKIVMAIFWLGVYILVNLTSVLWLGALAIHTLTNIDMSLAMLGLALFSLAYSLYGGLKAVALTDIIQVVLLIIGGLFLSYLSLNFISHGQGAWLGFTTLMAQAPEKFDMILSKDNPFYQDLPGISVVLGGMWIMHLSYWGFNQYIIQRTLAAKSLAEGQKGMVFAAFLKLLMPIIVVLPGIAAALVIPNLDRADAAYPSLMTLMPEGLRGIIFAALVAAIVSSLASMCNSVATIFTMDLYKRFCNRSDCHYVKVGRIATVIALLIAVIVAEPLLGKFDQAFQYIQEFTGFFTPGIVVLFLFGMFWQKTTANAALAAALCSAIFSLVLKLQWPALPFIDRVGLVFVLCSIVIIGLSLIWPNRHDTEHGIKLDGINFTTSTSFNLASVAVTIVVIALYITWW